MLFECRTEDTVFALARSLVTEAILAQGTNWAVAVMQAFFENRQRLSVILHD